MFRIVNHTCPETRSICRMVQKQSTEKLANSLFHAQIEFPPLLLCVSPISCCWRLFIFKVGHRKSESRRFFLSACDNLNNNLSTHTTKSLKNDCAARGQTSDSAVFPSMHSLDELADFFQEAAMGRSLTGCYAAKRLQISSLKYSKCSRAEQSRLRSFV